MAEMQDSYYMESSWDSDDEILHSSFHPMPYTRAPTNSVPHTHTLIFLHDRQSTSLETDDELCVATQRLAEKTDFRNWRFVFPQSVTYCDSMTGEDIFEWYKMYNNPTIGKEQKQVSEGLSGSVSYLRGLIDQQLKYVPAENLYIGGFGQGSAVALTALLSRNVRLGGFVGLANFIPLHLQIGEELADAETPRGRYRNLLSFYQDTFGEKIQTPLSTESLQRGVLRTPVFLGHSLDDNEIALSQGATAREYLECLGMPVFWRTYHDNGHRLENSHGVALMASFLRVHARNSVSPTPIPTPIAMIGETIKARSQNRVPSCVSTTPYVRSECPQRERIVERKVTEKFKYVDVPEFDFDQLDEAMERLRLAVDRCYSKKPPFATCQVS